MQIELTVDQLLGWVRAMEVEMAMTRAIEMGMLPRAHRKKKKNKPLSQSIIGADLALITNFELFMVFVFH